MLDESSGDEWVSRRNTGLRRPVVTLGHRTEDGIPYRAPEIQLFYKAANRRTKDETDFAAMAPLLDAPQRRWLDHAMADTYGEHPWRAAL